MSDPTADRLAVRDLVENWAVWRDAGDWERFRTVWHPDGRMMATWFQGPADDFIRVSQEGFARGVRILHFLGGTSVDLAGDRAIAQTKMTISQRGLVEGVLCDVVCTGRFYDFLERRDDRWGIVLRRLIYEKDRMDPVDPAARLELSPATLARFPDGYRHLSPRNYLTAANPPVLIIQGTADHTIPAAWTNTTYSALQQAGIGYDVKVDMPGLAGPEVDALYQRGARWLAGGPCD